MLRRLFALLATIPLTWCIREITKTAIFDWVTKKLEMALGLEEAQMIAFISTYTIPLAVAVAVIVSVYIVASKKRVPSTTSEPIAVAPGTAATGSAAQLALRRHYEGNDRKRLSDAMFDLYELLNKRVSPGQLEVHRITSGFLYRVRNEGSQFIVDKLSELREIFVGVRNELIEKFVPGNHYYADEMQDILSNKDLLNAELLAIDDYIAALKAIPSEPQEQLIRMMQPYQDTLRDANFRLGTWVGECNERIKAKRNALQ